MRTVIAEDSVLLRAGLTKLLEATGFEVGVPPGELPVTAAPSTDEVRILREQVDPTGARLREFR